MSWEGAVLAFLGLCAGALLLACAYTLYVIASGLDSMGC